MNLFTIDELADKTKYSKHTIYSKKKNMTIGLHYFQVPKGKIKFSDEAISFLLNIPKGKHENLEGYSLQEEKQSVSIYKYFN